MNAHGDLFHSKWDLAGLGMSTACALHCLAASILPGWLGGEATHSLFAIGSAGIALVAGVQGFFQHHEFRIWNWLIPGVALLLFARLAGKDQLGEPGEVVATVLGGTILVVMHRLNSSLRYWHDKY